VGRARGFAVAASQSVYPEAMPRSVALVTLGCARNEVDSEELAGRLVDGGWQLTDDTASADAVLVNTCGFIQAAKKDSIDTLLDVADGNKTVVAVGCLAERYGDQLAAALPEADAVLGFDAYAGIAQTLQSIVAGNVPAPHQPRDRRTLLPITPVHRAASAAPTPGHGDLPPGIAPASGPRPLRRRLIGGPTAPLKIASGCDRRCSFCAIPSFRGAYLSRTPDEIVAEAQWLVEQGVRELVLVSENSTSYGKDLGDVRLLEMLLSRLAAIADRVRVSYLQPAEVRPSLLDAMTSTAGVVPYFDLSFQHASGPILRRMRRFGDADRFLDLLQQVRDRDPTAGVRSNFIVGYPGETDADLDQLERFLVAARLDAIGVFGYSDEEGTEAASAEGKLPEEEIRARVEQVTALAEQVIAQRAEDRLDEGIDVLVESLADGVVEGRAAHQGPEVDGTTTLPDARAAIGAIVKARVIATDGVDLVGVSR
jgi:ribosomal protein S12 methylthiotransferase